MLKETLLAEAQSLDTSVELDSIFESVELSEDVKANFTTVFEQAVKANAVKLAESHINQIAERSDELVAEQVEARTQDIEQRLYEDTDKYFGHLAGEWMNENKEAVSKDIKADLFESMFVGLKELMASHNVVIPEGQVDVVAELEDELVENQGQVKSLFDQLQEKNKELSEMKRSGCIEKYTKDLTESQVEKVVNLIEGLDYSDKFEPKLHAIVEMVSAKKEKEEDDKGKAKETKDDFVPPTKKEKEELSEMDKYKRAAAALS